MPSEKGCETGEQVLGPNTGVRMKLAKSGKELGVEASVETLLGGVEVRVALSVMGAPVC